ncbi:MAG: GNAT family N-acetyltransferase [Tatlockia sp.]|nr:GNAT family N-acetyltransferase [Tatlockia sp.]MBA3978358.1 GNAT family N-acetyltransferase [Nitrosopumilus sp.]
MKITELSNIKYYSVRNFFGSDYPNIAFVLAVILDNIPGKIFVDRKINPTVCLVLCKGLPYCFIAGELSREIFLKFLPLMKTKPLIKLVCPSVTNKANINFIDFGFQPIERFQYRFKSSQSQIQNYINDSEYELLPIKDEKLLSLCQWNSFMTSCYGNTENYLKNSIGFVLWDPEKKLALSEAHGVIAENWVEIGTVTHENYRGKKLSTIVCNNLIQHLIKKGLHPIWSCDKANIPSWKVAEHQGMDDKIEYIFHTFKNNSLSKQFIN